MRRIVAGREEQLAEDQRRVGVEGIIVPFEPVAQYAGEDNFFA